MALSDGKRALIGILAFFGVVFTADGILITVGMNSHDGLVEKNYYQKGLHYDQSIQAKKRQAELGWAFALTPPPRTGQAPLEIRLTDAAGQPLSGLQVSASLRRPAQDGYDQDLQLQEVAPGTYRAEVNLPLAGLWDLHAQVRGSKDQATYRERFSIGG